MKKLKLPQCEDPECIFKVDSTKHGWCVYHQYKGEDTGIKWIPVIWYHHWSSPLLFTLRHPPLFLLTEGPSKMKFQCKTCQHFIGYTNKPACCARFLNSYFGRHFCGFFSSVLIFQIIRRNTSMYLLFSAFQACRMCTVRKGTLCSLQMRSSAQLHIIYI